MKNCANDVMPRHAWCSFHYLLLMLLLLPPLDVLALAPPESDIMDMLALSALFLTRFRAPQLVAMAVERRR